MEKFINKLAKWIVNHKVIIICIFVLLLALSIVGSSFVKKESDVISYLDKDTVTIQGLNTLKDEYGIIADFTLGVSYLSKEQVNDILTTIQSTNFVIKDGNYVKSKNGKYYEKVAGIGITHDNSIEGQKVKKEEYCINDFIKNVVWYGTFDKLSSLQSLSGVITADDYNSTMETLQEKFVKQTTLESGEVIDTYIISIYFSEPNSSDETIACLDKIEEILNDKISGYIEAGTANANNSTVSDYYAFGGSSNNSRTLIKSSLGDMPKFLLAAVACIFVILLVTTKSFFEPLIFLATLGISILLNNGTNLIAGNPIGTVSTITSSCSSILQLAIAMDYSIFLMHTYREELRKTPIPKDAMIASIPKTMAAISSSALTTVGGFIALFFMKFGIGYDLGFVLAKGVLLALVSVIFMQPVMILICSKIITKTSHEWVLEPRLKFISKGITKLGVAIPIIVICLAMAIPSSYFQSKVNLNYISTVADKEEMSVTEAVLEQQNNTLIVMVPFTFGDYATQQQFVDRLYNVGYQTDENNNAVLDSEGNKISDTSCHNVFEVFSLCTVLNQDTLNNIDRSAFRNTVYQLLHRSFVSDLITYKENGDFEKVDSSTEKAHYMLYTIAIDGGKEDVESYKALNVITGIANEVFGENSIRITGNSQASYELSEVTPNDFKLVSILSVAIIFVILLFTFKNPLLALILVGVIETGIWGNLTLTYLIGTKINFMAYLIVSSISLGATVDYAILVTSKYLDEKKNGMKGQAAIKNAIYRGAPSVLTSAAIFVIACCMVNLISSNIIVVQITELLARGAAISAVLVFTLLPAVLSIKERIFRQISIKRGKGDPDEGKSEENVYSMSSKKLKKMQTTQVAAESETNIVEATINETIETTDDSTNTEDNK